MMKENRLNCDVKRAVETDAEMQQASTEDMSGTQKVC
jgi:hypothetical protein